MNITQKVHNIQFSGMPLLWKPSISSNVQVFSSIPVQNDIFGTLTLGINKESSVGNEFKILLSNSFKKILGSEEIKILPEQKIMMGKYIEVNPEYRKTGRKRGYNFGELLRLSSIMTMLKNNLDSINIFSKGSAVYFHSKYKFEPDMSDYFERNKVLQAIMNDKSISFKDLAQRASKIYEQAKDKGNRLEGEKLTQETNALAKEYIDRVMQEKNPNLRRDFPCGMDMKLSKETILKNRDYFNTLFHKHGINYEI